MTDKKKTSEPGAVELTEEDLQKTQGGIVFAKYDGVDGEAKKKAGLINGNGDDYSVKEL